MFTALRRGAGLTVELPSSESTTIGLLARLSGLIEPLKEFVKTKSVWGTCAGAILLSQVVSNPKRGGQEVLGGVSVKITRNGWGSQVRHHRASSRRRRKKHTCVHQIESFEAPLEVSGIRDADVTFVGIFIRAPVRFYYLFSAVLLYAQTLCAA